MVWFRNGIIILLFWVVTTTCWATTLTLSGVPERVKAEDSFEVEVTFVGSKSGCGNKLYYLVGLLIAEGENKLFGLTENNAGEWIDKVELPSRSFAFTASPEGTWSGKLRVKAKLDDEGFLGAGTYLLRIDRFTATGTTKAESSNVVTLQFDYVSPSTPTPIPSITPQPTPTPTFKITPVPTTQITPSPTLMVTITPTPKVVKQTTISHTVATLSSYPVIGDFGTPSASVAGITDSTLNTSKHDRSFIPWLILGGCLLVLGGILPFGWKMLREQEVQ